MASLEMMTSLAADLPLAPSSPLRRSYTLNPRRLQRSGAREVTRKPPLPKKTPGSPQEARGGNQFLKNITYLKKFDLKNIS